MTDWLRQLALGTVLVLLFGLGASTGCAAGWQPASVQLKPVQVGPHSWAVIGVPEVADARNQGFMSNAGYVITPEGVVVIDALATPALAEKLLATIRSQTEAPIRRVILTHYHADHDYGIEVFQRAGAKVEVWRSARAAAGSEASKARLAERRRSLGAWLGDDFRVPQPDVWLNADERFVLGDVRFAVHYLGPAHSPDDLVVAVESDGVIFTGDLFYDGRVPYVGEESESRQWLKVLGELARMPASVMVPGHGPPTREPAISLAATRDYLAQLRRDMGNAVADLEEFDAAFSAADFSRFSREPAFAEAHRGNAYNVYLEMERESLEAKHP